MAGGGGILTAGRNGNDSNLGGNGGVGIFSTITGSNVAYAGGGGGGSGANTSSGGIIS